MDVDESPSMPLANVWNMLWDPGDTGKEPSIKFESKLLDDLLIALEKDAVEGNCAGVCDGCAKVNFLTDDYTELQLLSPYTDCSRIYLGHTFIVYSASISIRAPVALKASYPVILTGTSSNSDTGHSPTYR